MYSLGKESIVEISYVGCSQVNSDNWSEEERIETKQQPEDSDQSHRGAASQALGWSLLQFRTNKNLFAEKHQTLRNSSNAP